MSEIPEWAMEKANDIHLHQLGMSYRENVEAIASALAEERERCAALADKHASGGCACEGYGCTCGNYDDAGSAGAAATAKLIATTIRNMKVKADE